MRSGLIWVLAILVPLFTSCSYTKGFLKASKSEDVSSKLVRTASVKKSELPASEEDGAFHIVSRGETLRHICEVYGLDLKKVAGINDLKAPYSLNTGDTIFLPANALMQVPDEPAKTCSAPKTGPGKISKKKIRKKAGNRASARARKTACKKARLKAAKKKRSIRNVAYAIRGKRHPHVPKLTFPVNRGTLTSPFGYRWGVFHKGLDIAAPVGRSVRACADGRVVFVGTRKKFRSYGRIILLSHGEGVYTQYAHLHRIKVRKGEKVKRGQRIASVGNSGRSTGPHLHLEVRVRNQMYNPLAYFSRNDLKKMHIAKRFSKSPMGPIRARWKIPELLSAKR
ncbi:LysM peptidoglycan-binding domain-containing M23 family metallopeptidase [Thermodesulfobacteriota bacterium]